MLVYLCRHVNRLITVSFDIPHKASQTSTAFVITASIGHEKLERGAGRGAGSMEFGLLPNPPSSHHCREWGGLNRGTEASEQSGVWPFWGLPSVATDLPMPTSIKSSEVAAVFSHEPLVCAVHRWIRLAELLVWRNKLGT